MTPEAQPISVDELAARFRRSTKYPWNVKGRRWAMGFMRKLRHVRIGAELFTTEEWLAEWLAAESVGPSNWPKQNLDPLDEAVCSRVIQLVGELARRGQIQVRAV